MPNSWRGVDQAALPLDQQWLLRHADYRHEAARLGQPFLGPEDMEAGLAAFAGAAVPPESRPPGWATAPRLTF